MSDDHDLADEFLAHALMNETRDYIARGRKHADLDEAGLDALWVQLFRRLFMDQETTVRSDFDDVNAEFRLRGKEAPLPLVEEELKLMRERLDRIGPDARSESLDREIDTFLIERGKPKN